VTEEEEARAVGPARDDGFDIDSPMAQPATPRADALGAQPAGKEAGARYLLAGWTPDLKQLAGEPNWIQAGECLCPASDETGVPHRAGM